MHNVSLFWEIISLISWDQLKFKIMRVFKAVEWQPFVIEAASFDTCLVYGNATAMKKCFDQDFRLYLCFQISLDKGCSRRGCFFCMVAQILDGFWIFS